MKPNFVALLSLTLLIGLAAHAESMQTSEVVVTEHYGAGFGINKTQNKLMIDTQMKISNQVSGNLDQRCIDLFDKVKSSIVDIAVAIDQTDAFTIDVQKRIEETGIGHQIYVCRIEIESRNEQYKFQKIESKSVDRQDFDNNSETDPNVLNLTSELRKDAMVVNYFHAKRALWPTKSFVEYVKVIKNQIN